MKNLFDYDKVIDFLRKNAAVDRGSIRVFYMDEHRKNAGGVPEYKVKVTFSLTGQKKPQNQMMMGMMGSSKPAGYEQDFWCVGYDFKRMYAKGDQLFGGFLEAKDFTYMY